MTTKSKDRTKASGEVFTPRSLIREMLGRLPNTVWFDPNKRWLEPAAGDGNFLVEIKARLLQVGHDEIHILENMLFSIELIDDNHWALQHRLGYLMMDGKIQTGKPNPYLNKKNFTISKISQLAQDLNDKNPYEGLVYDGRVLARDEVLHHRNHVCDSGLVYPMDFGRVEGEEPPKLRKRVTRELGAWSETDTPKVGERYVVERMLGKQPQLEHLPEPIKVAKAPKVIKAVVSNEARLLELIAELWDPAKKPTINRALLPSKIWTKFIAERGLKKASSELQAEVKKLVNGFEPKNT